MKAYYYEIPDGMNRGFFRTKSECRKEIRELKKNRGWSDDEIYMEEVEWTHSKGGIVDLLNIYAPNGDEPNPQPQ